MHAESATELYNKIVAGVSWLRDADDAVKSWFSFRLYKVARKIVALPTKEGRADAINKCPETWRDELRQEVLKQWSARPTRKK